MSDLPKDLLSLGELSRTRIEALFDLAAAAKAAPRDYHAALTGRAIVLLFEKDSLRTLLTFQIGMARLGGTAVHMDHRTNRIGVRESVVDYARNLERWADGIVARTFEHATVTALASNASIPVINALSDEFHPCQALADFFTLREHFGDLRGRKLAYVGDGNNVCHSLLLGAAALGVAITVICPQGYAPSDAVVAQARATPGAGSIAIGGDPAAVAGHDAVYTDTWTSMGQEAEARRRQQAFRRYQVTQQVMDAAGPHAIFMHCLPAHRGQEVSAEVIDGPRSVVYEQAENRMHVQNALLMGMLGRSDQATKRPSDKGKTSGGRAEQARGVLRS